MRKNSQADRAQDNSDSYIRERLRLPRGVQGEITIRKVKKKKIYQIYILTWESDQDCSEETNDQNFVHPVVLAPFSEPENMFG